MPLEVKAKSIFSKILSKENIDLIQTDRVDTACIDLEKRVMYLPEWQCSDELTRMLIGHEISHALFTPAKDWLDSIDNVFPDYKNLFKHILNVVEDVRIDWKIMTKYPGLRFDYRKGMKELLNEFNFFGDIASFNEKGFLSRLNTHLKLNVSGMNSFDIKFTDTEQPLVDECLLCDSFDDVIEVSKKIFNVIDVDEELPPLTYLLDKDMINGNSLPQEDENIIPQDINDTLTVKRVNTSRIVKMPKASPMTSVSVEDSQAKMMRNYFVKRKNALNLSERQFKKTGIIDDRKLKDYRFSSSIFKKDVIVPRQQNHGLIVLVDGSESMSDVMQDVAKQAYNLAMFCKYTRIPFRCFMFKSEINKEAASINNGPGDHVLVEFFKKGRFKDDFYRLCNSAEGSTPLTTSLMSMFTVVDEFINKNRTDRNTFILITDGQCNHFDYFRRYKYEKSHNFIIQKLSTISGIYENRGPLLELLKDTFSLNVITIDINKNISRSKNPVYDSPGVDIHMSISPNDLRKPSNLFIEKYMKFIL